MPRFAPILLFLLFALRAFGAGEWTLLKYENRDYVTLANIGAFYQLGPVLRTGNQVQLRTAVRSLRGEVGSAEFYLNNLKFILSYPVVDIGCKPSISRMDLTKLLEPVLRPSRIQNSATVDTIILDPGHGGGDSGATCLFGNEKTFALDVALRARDMLRAAKFRVYMTRSTDRFVPLEERAAIASRFPNALFISIHFNSSGNGATGVETYTLAPRGVPSMATDGPSLSDLVPCTGNARDAENIALACATHATLVCNSAMFDRGIKRARFVVLRDSAIPGVLIEGGFLSNPNDARRIANVLYRQQMAGSILQAVQNYCNAVGPRQALPVASAATPPPGATGPTVITSQSAAR
ncbi:MAG: N-acetylmuramoyl-L-alanine amidase [Chthoniobacteraceae bacterium]|nr:N-acetylmuramoyl-L-alanine amidase [Chthoniobacteraceae bacterium]